MSLDAVCILWVYPAHFVGLLAASTCYWFLQGISHLFTGRYLIGFVGGVCLYGAMAPAVAVLEEELMSRGVMVAMALSAGLGGPAVAFDSRFA